MTLKIEIDAHPDNGPLAEQVDEAMAALGFHRTLSGQITPITAQALASSVASVVGNVEQTLTNAARAGETSEQTAVRERGKPAPGRARRTKEEIAEDEAADAAEAGSTKPSISTGEERIDPAEVEAQDKADEQAEVDATRKEDKPLTVEDVKAVLATYVSKYGMPAIQEDGPKIFVEALGKPPEGEEYWKLSLLPDNQEKLAKVISTWKKAVELNPLKRAEV